MLNSSDSMNISVFIKLKFALKSMRCQTIVNIVENMPFGLHNIYQNGFQNVLKTNLVTTHKQSWEYFEGEMLH